MPVRRERTRAPLAFGAVDTLPRRGAPDPGALHPSAVLPLRDALAATGYTVERVTALLGPAAHEALLRDSTVPGLRATAAEQVAGTPLATLTRLWPLQAPVDVADAERALPGVLGALLAAGFLVRAGDQVRAALDVRPYGDDRHDWWVVSDLTPGLDGRDRAVPPDHVLGVSPASSTLAQLAVRHRVDRALDLGAGCGVQALHLGTHAQTVVATDVNARALAATRLTAALAGRVVQVRAGSLWEPVAGEEYDLVLTNPPFVVSPGTGERLVYRDSGLPGDEFVRRVVTAAPRHLAPGGWCQVLANWVHARGQPWQERVAGWLAGSGCDAWVLQRELVDPARYVEMWLADAGLAGRPQWAQRYDAWLDWMATAGVEAVGMGWLCLRRTDRAEPVLRVEDWPWEVDQPVAPQVTSWAARVDALAAADGHGGHGMQRLRPVRPADVVQETYGRPGDADPQRIVLRRGTGLRRARVVDTVEAGLVGACDGDLDVGQLLDALATLLGRDPGELRAAYLPIVRDLVEEGWLEP